MKTTMKLWSLGAIAGLALLTAACDNKPAETKPEDPAAKNGTTTASTTTANAAPTTAPAPAPVTIADADLATPADFEEAAEKQITTKNYKAELTTLEKEMEKDGS